MTGRESYSGGAITTVKVDTGFNAGAASFAGSITPTGFPTSVQFVVAVGVMDGQGRLVSNVEKMLVTRSGTAFTVVARGHDGTSAVSHASGEAILHVFSAAKQDDLDDHVYDTTRNDHTQYRLATDDVGTADIDDAAITTAKLADGAVTTVKIADANVTSAKLAAAVAGDGLAGGAGSALSVNVDDSTIEKSADALRVKDGGVTLAKLAAATVPRWMVGPFLIALTPSYTASAMAYGALDLGVSAARMVEAGSIIGLSVDLSHGRTVGSATFEVYNASGATGLTVVCDGSNADGGTSSQSRGADTFLAGGLLRVRLTTTSDFDTSTPGSDFAVAHILCSL